MFKSILPKEYAFFDFFENHAELIFETCHELLRLTSEEKELPGAVQRVKDLEHQADDLTHQCIDALHRTFITPIDRPDIHQLIKRMDDIIDCIDGGASRMALYGITGMRPEAKALAEVLVKASECIKTAVHALRNLKNSAIIIEQCHIIHDLENQGDEILRSSLFRLFRESDPIMIIKWKEIFERLEKSVDRCEDVANIIEGVVISAS